MGGAGIGVGIIFGNFFGRQCATRLPLGQFSNG